MNIEHLDIIRMCAAFYPHVPPRVLEALRQNDSSDAYVKWCNLLNAYQTILATGACGCRCTEIILAHLVYFAHIIVIGST